MKSIFLTTALTLMLFSCQQTTNPQPGETHVKEEKKKNEAHSYYLELALCSIVDDTFAAEADSMLPWVYEKYSALGLIRFEEYDMLAALQECWEINNNLSEADSINERKLLTLYNNSSDSFPTEHWNMKQLWQFLDYEERDGDDSDTERSLNRIAKENNLSDFLERYKKLYSGKLRTSVKATESNSDLSMWVDLHKRSSSMYDDLKRKVILGDSSLNSDEGFKMASWGRYNLRR